MKQLLFTLLLTLTAMTAAAQNFTTHLQEKKNGQGQVTLHQDPRLTSAINGNGQTAKPSATTADNTQDETPSPKTGKKMKVRGYRVQIFWGGSTNADKQKAQQMAERVSQLMPETSAYSSFESPHWRCRVGDFTDRQEAIECMKKLREVGLGHEAMIVRSEVYIYQ